MGLPISEAVPGMMSDNPDPGLQGLDFELMPFVLKGRPFEISHFTPETLEIILKSIYYFWDSLSIQPTWRFETLCGSGLIIVPRHPLFVQS